PELGRLITRDDDVPGAPNRVVLTYGYWQRVFGGARDVIGRSLNIAAPNARPYEIVGVLPASCSLFKSAAALLLPLRLNRANANPVALGYRGVARLKPGVTIAQANED